MKGDIKDAKLKGKGVKRINWAEGQMPVLEILRKIWEKEKPLDGIRISACLHVTTETGVLMKTLKSAGAKVALCASNPLSTQNDVAAALTLEYDIPCYAIRGENNDTYYSHINACLDIKPHITIDDGADLVTTLHQKRKDLLQGVLGGTEETTTGVIRLKAMAKQGYLKYPIVAVNDAMTKHLFDNRFGTGQSTIDGILRATNILLSGKTFVVAGYGWCGRGVAMRARGMGAEVIICEIDPVRALEARMDGYRVMTMMDASKIGDVFVTVTGCKEVINAEHMSQMKDGAIISNSGHFNVEIDIESLEEIAISVEIPRENVKEYLLKSGNKVCLLAEGRLVNLSAAEGHPAIVMDMSFANQAKAAVWLSKGEKDLKPDIYRLPEEIDKEIASLKLKSMGITIDKLTEEQVEYLTGWEIGT